MRIQSNTSEIIFITALNSVNAFVTGLTDVLLEIRRKSDGFYFDFADTTFKNSGWITRQQIMTELNATYSPGVYYYNFVSIAENEYLIRATSAIASNSPWEGELKVGGFIDNLDSSIEDFRNAIEDKIIAILGLVQSNTVITSQVYDGDNNLISATIKIYPTATDANADTNMIKSFSMTASYTSGLLTNYKVVEN